MQAYHSPTSCDTKCLSERTELFFYDCMPHLMGAAQIYDEIPQLFNRLFKMFDAIKNGLLL